MARAESDRRVDLKSGENPLGCSSGCEMENSYLRSFKKGSPKRRSRFTKQAVSVKSSEIGVWAFIV